jgi:hypothetical protein
VGYYRFNILNGIRASAAKMFLAPILGKSSNLVLETKATVRRIILSPVKLQQREEGEKGNLKSTKNQQPHQRQQKNQHQNQPQHRLQQQRQQKSSSRITSYIFEFLTSSTSGSNENNISSNDMANNSSTDSDTGSENDYADGDEDNSDDADENDSDPKFKAVGVEYEQNGVVKFAYLKSNILSMGSIFQKSRSVIVTAGAIMTPKLLMNSGIGPRAVLESAGVGLKVELPELGLNLQDHPTVGVVFKLGPSLSSGINLLVIQYTIDWLVGFKRSSCCLLSSAVDY